MVITKYNMIEEQKGMATAAGQAKQCAWVNWNGAEANKLTALVFTNDYGTPHIVLLHATYNFLPNHANHQLRDFTGDNTRAMCLQEGYCSIFTPDVHLAL